MPVTRAVSWRASSNGGTAGTEHHPTPAARLQGHGFDLDCGAHRCVVGPKPPPEQGLRVQSANVGSLHRPGDHPPHAQTARPEVKLLKHPLKTHGGAAPLKPANRRAKPPSAKQSNPRKNRCSRL